MKNPLRPPVVAALLALLLVLQARAQQVIFSEIMYNPQGDLPEYIELTNNTATPYDIAEWELRGGVRYNFPDFDDGTPLLTFLKAFERILISSVAEADLRAAYPSIPADTRIYGPWEGLAEDGTRASGNLSQWW